MIRHAAFKVSLNQSRRREFGKQSLPGGPRYTTVVLAEIADIEVDGHCFRFRPGVYRQMRFGEQPRVAATVMEFGNQLQAVRS